MGEMNEEKQNRWISLSGIMGMVQTDEGERFAKGGSKRPFCKGFANRSLFLT